MSTVSSPRPVFGRPTPGVSKALEPTVVTTAGLSDLDDIARRTAELMQLEGTPVPRDTILRGVRKILESNGALGRYFVLRRRGRSVGQVLVQPVFAPARGGTIWWLDDAYVDEPYRKQGMFSAAFRHIETLAMSDPRVIGLRLQVKSDNGFAKHAYKSKGMKDNEHIVMEHLWLEPAVRYPR